jgi:hypothetical protein
MGSNLLIARQNPARGGVLTRGVSRTPTDGAFHPTPITIV